jgi:hypothetical protein
MNLFVRTTLVAVRSVTGAHLLLIPALVLVFASAARAQASADRARNSVYLELFGNGGVYSLNYDRALTEGLRVRVGFAGWTSQDLFGGPDTSMRTVPVSLHLLRGRGRHQADIGGGIVTGRKTRDTDFPGESGSFTSVIGVIGYRYQRPEGGFVFRAGFTPFYGFGDEDDAYPQKGFLSSVGVSLGFGF